MKIGGSLLKYFICFFNLVFVLCGVLFMVWAVVTIKELANISNGKEGLDKIAIPVLAIILGFAVFIVAFFGCCGAITENVCCTLTYAVFMLIITILQVALVVFIFVKREEFHGVMSEFVQNAFVKSDDHKGMDPLQISFKCCGLKNYQDYDKGKVPITCCGIIPPSNETCTEEVYKHRSGCHDVFVEFWKANTNIVTWVGSVIAVFEFVLLWLACTLAAKIRASR